MKLSLLRSLRIIVSILPRILVYSGCFCAGYLCALIPSKMRSSVLSNLRTLFNAGNKLPEFFKNYFFVLCDFLRFTDIDAGQAAQLLSIRNSKYKKVIKLMEECKGVICLTPHFGFWELGPVYFSASGVKTNVIYHEYKDKQLARFFKGIRRKDINWISTANAPRECLSALKRGELLATAIDIDYGKQGHPVPFLGTTLRISVGPALFSYHSGAPIVMCYAPRVKGLVYQAEFEDVIYPNRNNGKAPEIARLCTEIARAMERRIKKSPEQWFIFDRPEKL
jgi:lauroyl/myristoyl acyltransferase